MRSGPLPRGRLSMPQRKRSSGIDRLMRAALRAAVKRNAGWDFRYDRPSLIISVLGMARTLVGPPGAIKGLKSLESMWLDMDLAGGLRYRSHTVPSLDLAALYVRVRAFTESL